MEPASRGDHCGCPCLANRSAPIEIRPGRRLARDPVKKMKDHDVRVLILGMGREVAIARRIPVLVKATANRHDLPRTVLLAPLLDFIPVPESQGNSIRAYCPGGSPPLLVASRRGMLTGLSRQVPCGAFPAFGRAKLLHRWLRARSARWC